MSAAKGIFDQMPDIGITRKVPRDSSSGPRWCVDISVYSLSTGEARQLAAELINSADMADELNAKITADERAAQ